MKIPKGLGMMKAGMLAMAAAFVLSVGGMPAQAASVAPPGERIGFRLEAPDLSGVDVSEKALVQVPQAPRLNLLPLMCLGATVAVVGAAAAVPHRPRSATAYNLRTNEPVDPGSPVSGEAMILPEGVTLPALPALNGNEPFELGWRSAPDLSTSAVAQR